MKSSPSKRPPQAETPMCNTVPLEGYLLGDLSGSTEQALTDHLDQCVPCRQKLETLAAERGEWDEAASLLRRPSLDGEDHAVARVQQPLMIQHVLDLLDRTDDPNMLGRLGGYEISGVVGAGAMGVVLKGYDKSLDRTVAIKVMAPHLASNGAARKRFAREAKAAAAVLHTNVMAIHSVSNDGALPYLVMPYVGGASLQKRLETEGPLPTAEVLRIGGQIASGLQAAHAQGLVHRDIKPANILLENGVERIAITDFGLARAVDDATMTRSGVITGTPQYMSPEQARGEVVDTRSDLFSLGSLLYALCTGRPPFRADTSYGILRRITDSQPRPIRQINPEVPEWLCKVVSRLMAKDPKDRYESAGEVGDLLSAWLAHLQQPSLIPPPDRIELSAAPFGGSMWSRLQTFLAGVVFGLVLLLAGIVILLETRKGTIRIECSADDVPLRIKQGDQIVEELTVSKSGASVRVAAGMYVVEFAGEVDGIAIDDGTVSLDRAGEAVVRIVEQADKVGQADQSEAGLQAETARSTLDAKTLEVAAPAPFEPAAKPRKPPAEQAVESIAPAYRHTPFCSIPLPHLTRPTSWSDTRYNAFLLSHAEIHALLDADATVSARLSSIYHAAENEWLIAIEKTNGNPEVTWEKVLSDMHDLLTVTQRMRATQLSRQQMGLAIFASNDPLIQLALDLTKEQRRQIAEIIAFHERSKHQLNHNFAEVGLPREPVRRPMLHESLRAAASKKPWLLYWLDRQTESQILAKLTSEQERALSQLCGAAAAPIQPPWDLFERNIILRLVETMAPGPYQTKLIHLRPPTEDEICTLWMADQDFRNQAEPRRDMLHVIREKLVDHTMDTLPGEDFHPGQWHVAIYASTVYRNDVIGPAGVIFTDVARFYPTIENDVIETSSGNKKAFSAPLDTQVLVQRPVGATLSAKSKPDGTLSIRIPGRLSIKTGETMQLQLTEIPEHPGVTLSASIESVPPSEYSKAYLRHNAVPMEITTEDIDQATSGNLVTKVVYLPSPEEATQALAGVETLVTTRLGPGVDPLQEASSRGRILAVLILGNRADDETPSRETPSKETPITR